MNRFRHNYLRIRRGGRFIEAEFSHLLIFNIELLDLDEDLGDYVIVHELLHLRVPNHGKLWKSLMRVYLGDYEHLEERLKQIAPAVRSEW